MSKWIAEFDLEDGDTMPEHMDLNYMGARIDFHCRPMWIPVSERLPEEYGEYLIMWTGILGEHSAKRTKPLIAIAEYEIYEPENYADWITTMYEFEHYHDIKVLAWMPLPKPYEPQERSDKECI